MIAPPTDPETTFQDRARRLARALEASARDGALSREEHCRLLLEFERLVERRVQKIEPS